MHINKPLCKYVLILSLFLVGCSSDSNGALEMSGEDSKGASEISGEEFNGYPCVDDCSGHKAGYEWAEENDIDDSDDCGGNSNSFIEGCQSYVEEQE